MKVDRSFRYVADEAGNIAGWMRTAKDSPDRVYGFGQDSDIVKIPDR
jgi:hypothetical protein